MEVSIELEHKSKITFLTAIDGLLMIPDAVIIRPISYPELYENRPATLATTDSNPGCLDQPASAKNY